MLEIAIVLIHALHLLCMNVAGGGPLVCIWLDWKERSGDPQAGEAGRSLALAALVALLVGAALGVALGALLWDDAYVAILKRLPTKIRDGVWELLFSLLLLAIYLAWWNWRRRAGTISRILRSVLAVVLATNLLYHFPVLFGVISQLSNEGAVESGPIDSAAFRQHLLTSYVGSRSIHFVLASIAVSGVALIAYCVWRAGRSDDSAWPRLARTGGWFGLAPSLAQIPVGMWVLLGLPDDAKRRLMGQDAIGSTLLVVSVIAALWLMHLLSAIAIGKATPRKCRLAIGATVVIVVLMTAVSRRAWPPETPAAPKAPAALETPASLETTASLEAPMSLEAGGTPAPRQTATPNVRHHGQSSRLEEAL